MASDRMAIDSIASSKLRLKHRQNELASLPSDKRRELMASELEQQLKRMPSDKRRLALAQLKAGLAPGDISQKDTYLSASPSIPAAQPIPMPDPKPIPAPEPETFESLLGKFRAALLARSDVECHQVLESLARDANLPPAHGDITVADFAKSLLEVGKVASKPSDPVFENATAPGGGSIEEALTSAIAAKLNGIEENPVSAQFLAKLSSALLLELALLQQVANMFVRKLDNRFFDPVHGVVRRSAKDELETFLRAAIDAGNLDEFIAKLRDYTGAVKEGLCVYHMTIAEKSEDIKALDPDLLEARSRRAARRVEPSVLWEAFKQEYGNRFESADAIEENIKAEMKMGLATRLVNRYHWKRPANRNP